MTASKNPFESWMLCGGRRPGCSLTLLGRRSASTHHGRRRGAETQSRGVGPVKRQLYMVLHTIKYAFAKWCSILPFQRFMHCLGRGGGRGGSDGGGGGRMDGLVVEEVLSNGAKQECRFMCTVNLVKKRDDKEKGVNFSCTASCSEQNYNHYLHLSFS